MKYWHHPWNQLFFSASKPVFFSVVDYQRNKTITVVTEGTFSMHPLTQQCQFVLWSNDNIGWTISRHHSWLQLLNCCRWIGKFNKYSCVYQTVTFSWKKKKLNRPSWQCKSTNYCFFFLVQRQQWHGLPLTRAHTHTHTKKIFHLLCGTLNNTADIHYMLKLKNTSVHPKICKTRSAGRKWECTGQSKL